MPSNTHTHTPIHAGLYSKQPREARSNQRCARFTYRRTSGVVVPANVTRDAHIGWVGQRRRVRVHHHSGSGVVVASRRWHVEPWTARPVVVPSAAPMTRWTRDARRVQLVRSRGTHKGVAEHIGIATAAFNKATHSVATVEGNTGLPGANQSNGDGVYTKNRDASLIRLAIRPKWRTK